MTTATAMPFGKHKGEPLNEVPGAYLRWCLRECANLQLDLRRAIEDELDRRFAERGAEVTIEPPPTMQAFVTAWYRRMSMKYHPDRGGTDEQMKVVNAGVELFRELAGVKT